MKLISEKAANVLFGRLKKIEDQNGLSSAEKAPKVGAVLENLFRESTKDDVKSNESLFNRMIHIFDNNSIPKHIVDGAHEVRILCNQIRHNGLKANTKDYEGSVKSVSDCIFYFSEVDIPDYVQAIYDETVKIKTPITQTPEQKPQTTPPPLTIRQQDLVNNPSARLPMALLLDCSGSMTLDNRIGELNKGVDMFFNSILADEVTRYSVELSIITFGGTVEQVLDFANVERQINEFKSSMPIRVKSISDGTPMGEAVELALKKLQVRKEEYKVAGVEYYQPWLVIMTDGQPTDSIINASTLTSKLVVDRKLSLFPVAIGDGANMAILSKFSSKRAPLKLKGLNFREFFEWLRESAKSASQSTPGTSVNLPPIGWASL
jgi:uncharacterized protein YegL